MASLLRKLSVFGLLLLPFVSSPSQLEEMRVTSAPPVLVRRVDMPELTTTSTTTTTVPTGHVREGMTGAQQQQAEDSWDGDRFDRLSFCEAGNDPEKNTGNGFYGAFQFVLASWKSAWSSGGFGDIYGRTDETGSFIPAPAGYPMDWSYDVQKQVAMFWASVTNPYRQWPVCWPKSAG